MKQQEAKLEREKRPSENWLEQRLKSDGSQHQTSICGPKAPTQRQWAWKRRGRSFWCMYYVYGILNLLISKSRVDGDGFRTSFSEST